jgi:hypothetical protein
MTLLGCRSKLIAQVVEQGLRGEFPGIGDLEDEVLRRKKGHAMLFAALQGIVSQHLLHVIDREPATFAVKQVAQGTDFIVN